MNTQILEKVEQKYINKSSDEFQVGDTVKVHNIIREGEKNRTQIFKGVVIAKKGSGVREMFTVRKISDGVGVEKIFPLQSPNVDKIEVVKTGKVKRSKLYYLRERVGKKALKVKAGRDLASKDTVKASEKSEKVIEEKASASKDSKSEKTSSK